MDLSSSLLRLNVLLIVLQKTVLLFQNTKHEMPPKHIEKHKHEKRVLDFFGFTPFVVSVAFWVGIGLE